MVGFGQAAIIPLGAGSYTDTLPGGWLGPVNNVGVPVLPQTTAGFTQVPATNKWWGTFLWKYYDGNNYGVDMYPWPWSLQPFGNGLGLKYETAPVITANDYHYFIGAVDFTASVTGLASPDTRVVRYGDWDMTAEWNDGSRTLRATAGNGFPYVYFEATGGSPQVNFTGAPTVVSNVGPVLIIQYGTKYYGFYGPSGSTWTPAGFSFTNSASGSTYYSAAILPDVTAPTLAFYQAHAYAFPTNTTVSWGYNAATADLTSTFTVAVTAKEGGQTTTAQALFRHQWLSYGGPVTPYTYVGARGPMRVVDGNSFSTVMRFNGVLPALPREASFDTATIYNYVNCYYTGACGVLVPWGAGADTYAWGKYFERLSDLIWIADLAGHTAARDGFTRQIELGMEDWFNANGGVGHLFYYDSNWKTLIGYPSGFGSGTDINDHHFHYAYWIKAMATIARFDNAWWVSSGWQAMAQELIADVANRNRASTRYPFLRNFSPYEGLFWANGHAQPKGNDNESSSEAMNLAGALILLGSETGDLALRDQGIFQYMNAVAGTEQYWLDVDDAVFPPAYNHNTAGMVWGNGVEYQTYFGTYPANMHMIQFLPITASNIYLGRNPAYMQANINQMLAEIGGPSTAYKEIIWGAQALYDPAFAIANFNADPGYTEDDGSSRANTYHWLHFFDCVGQLDTTVTADHPNYNVFNKAGVKAWAAYNPNNTPLTVSYSDGHVMNLAPKELRVEGGCTPVPTPTPTPCNAAYPTQFHLVGATVGGVSPDGHFLNPTTVSTGALGALPLPNVTVQNGLTWYSEVLTGSISAGAWSLLLWTNNTGGSALVQATLGYCNPDGSAYAGLGSVTVNVNGTGGGNHTSTFNFGALPLVSLNGQRLRLQAVWADAGANYPTVYYNAAADFDSRLTLPSGAGVCPVTPTNTPTPSGTPTRTPTRTSSPTPTLSPTPSPFATPTWSPSGTPTWTSTLSHTPSDTATGSPSMSPSPTGTPVFSATATGSETPSSSPSPSQSGSPTPTSSPTATPSFSGSPSETLTPSPSQTRTPTPTFSASPTPSLSPSITQSFSPSLTRTISPTPSGSPTATPTRSSSPTLTASSTLTPSPSLSPTFSFSPTPSPSFSASPTATLRVDQPFSFDLAIFNSAGERVRVLVAGGSFGRDPSDWEILDSLAVPEASDTALILAAGRTFAFDGRGDSGQPVKAGSYYALLTVRDPFGVSMSYSGKMTVLRGTRGLRLCVSNSAGEILKCLTGTASAPPAWDGLDAHGQAPKDGVYALSLTEESPGGTLVRSWQELVLKPAAAPIPLSAGPSPWKPEFGPLRIRYGSGDFTAALYNLAGERISSSYGRLGKAELYAPQPSSGIYLLKCGNSSLKISIVR